MTYQGKINQISRQYRDFIRQTALHGQFDKEGNLNGTRKIVGYVADYHEDGELKGTIDVQEYDYGFDKYEVGEEGEGLHKGVKLCATQSNEGGVLIVPLLYSEVVIVKNPSNQEEYVIAWSHANAVQIETHEVIHFGVTEYEPFVETEDGLEKDYDELEPTGKKSMTDYDKDTIRDEISVNGKGLVQTKTATQKTIEVGSTKITIDGESVTIETSAKVTFKVGGSTITEDTGNVNVKASNVKVDGKNVEITGGILKTKGVSSVDMNGPFNPIKTCPFTGAPHCGSIVLKT